VEITSFSFDIKQRLGKFNVALDCLKYLWVCSAGIVLERKLSFETNEATSSTCFSFFVMSCAEDLITKVVTNTG